MPSIHADIAISLKDLTAFLLLLSRISGVFVYIPLPGKDAGPSLPRIVLAFALTLTILPYSRTINFTEPTFGLLLLWITAELALGVTLGLVVSFLTEALTLGAQILSLQAGYAYASVIDPTTQADSDVLQVLSQLLGGLLFFSLHMDHFILKTFVLSLHSIPPGQFALTTNLARAVLALSSNLFVVSLQLALPIVAVLLTVEISLAVVGRLNTQLHLGSEAASIKMMLTLLILVSLFRVVPEVYAGFANHLTDFMETQFWGSGLVHSPALTPR